MKAKILRVLLNLVEQAWFTDHILSQVKLVIISEAEGMNFSTGKIFLIAVEQKISDS